MDAEPAEVTAAYQQFLDTGVLPRRQLKSVSGYSAAASVTAAQQAPNPASSPELQQLAPPASAPVGVARLRAVHVRCATAVGRELQVRSGKDDVSIEVEFVADPALPTPTVAVALVRADGSFVASAGTHNDGVPIQRRPDGSGEISLVFQRLPLLKGEYAVNVYLLSEDGIHPYDQASMVAWLKVSQEGLEQGIVSLPHQWLEPATRAL